MKKEDLINSFNKIKPSESEKQRMLDNILTSTNRKKGVFMTLFNFKKAIPALVLVIVIAGSLLTYSIMMEKYNSHSQWEHDVADDANWGREDFAAPILNQFQIDGKHYILLSDELRVDYSLPAVISERDIGEKIADITTGPDKSLIGSEIYNYMPAGGKAVVAVKKNNEYQLYRFFVFESYNNNQDEDSIEYLRLYGIDKAGDIAKIQFIRHSEQSKLQGRMDIIGEITDRNEIDKFYNFYSSLKNSSDKYFDRLFNFKGKDTGSKDIEIDIASDISPDIAPDMIISPDRPEPDMISPDQIGYGVDLPMNVASDQPYVAEDSLQVIGEKNKASAVSGDTSTTSHTQAAVNSSHGMMDMGGTGTVEPSKGSVGEALANPISIRIYNQNGIYYDSIYYMNIGFINRYEVSEDFADFLSEYIGKQ